MCRDLWRPDTVRSDSDPLLGAVLADVTALKAAMASQGEINRTLNDFAQAALASTWAQDVLNAEVRELIRRHNQFVERVTGLLAEIDERLHALDGKRSLRDDRAVAVADTAAPVAAVPAAAEG